MIRAPRTSDRDTGGTKAQARLKQILEAPELPAQTSSILGIHGSGTLRARHPVGDLACATLGTAALAVARRMNPQQPPEVQLDRVLTSWWFGYTLRPGGWTRPHVRSAATGDHRTQDGWIRIHANAPHHWQRAQEMLGLGDGASRDEVAAQVRRWHAQELEDTLIERVGCAAALHTSEDWAAIRKAGPAYRLRPPCVVGGIGWRWNRGAVALRGDAAEFT